MSTFSKAVKGVIIGCHAVAISSTCFRLLHRIRKRRVWYDDLWAIFALISDILLLVVYLTLPITSYFKYPLVLQQFLRISTLISYTCVLWGSRISVAVTIVRLLNCGSFRRLAKAISIFFVLICTCVMIQKFFICSDRSLKSLVSCPISPATGILELSTDLAGDVWLLLAPGFMLWQMKLPRSSHRLILAIFACGVFNTGASIAHTVFILKNNGLWISVTGHIQATIALTICNLLVVVTCLYRVFNRDSNSSAEESSESKSSSSPQSQERTTGHALASSAQNATNNSHLSTLPSSLVLTDVLFGSSFDTRNSVPMHSIHQNSASDRVKTNTNSSIPSVVLSDGSQPHLQSLGAAS